MRRVIPTIGLVLVVVVTLLVSLTFSIASASAVALSPWFHLTSVSRPGHLAGKKGEIAVTAVNVGDADVNASATPLVLTDILPEHLKARFVQIGTENIGARQLVLNHECEVSETRRVTCTFAGGILPPFHQLEILIGVSVEAGATTGEVNQTSVSGGGAPQANAEHPITVDESPTPFGVEDYEAVLEEVGGGLATQAGSHPFQYTTTFDLSAGFAYDPSALKEVGVPAALAKDLTFKLPPGLVGNPTAYPRCSLGEFLNVPRGGANLCPIDTVIGVAVVTFSEMQLSGPLGLQTRVQPIYNLEPSPGEPAKFGFSPAGVPVYLDTSVRTGEDYGVTVHVKNIPQLIGFLSNTVTFWGVPADARHNDARSPGCLEEDQAGEAPCQPDEIAHSPAAFLTLPTSCSGEPLQSTVEATSWQEPGKIATPTPNPTVPMTTLDGCGLLPFHSEIKVTPDLEAGSTPSGLTVDVHVPQEGGVSAEGLANPDVKNITVTLPEGLALNPSASDGLQACSEAQIGLHNDNEATCPNASKIANVTITTPLLPNPLKGFVYLASPQNFTGPLENPFGSLVAMYLVAQDPVSGTLVKLPGSVSLSETGQISSTFANDPQLPFEDAEISFFGGERAPLATPARCASYTTNAIFEPWTNTEASHEALRSSSTFDIASGPNGTPCPGAALPFSPSLSSQTTDVNAGSFTPLSTTLSREDGQQSIGSVVLHYPPGVSGLLAGVKLCDEADANQGTCGPESLIGETIVSVGLGGDPFSVTGGKVYITEKYGGAPFGLSIVNPANAGPFVLQEGRPVVVRAKVEVDPITAALTVTTDPSGPHAIPSIIEGIPLQIQHVNVLIDRPGFTFNPTDCNPMRITGAISSTEGASSPVGVPFQVANCAVLAFKPSFKVSTSGKTSRQNGASLNVKLAYPKAPFGSQANISSVKVELPKQLPSELKTLQHACPHEVFEANPAACSSASRVGFAKATTPLLPVSLEGPAYFVSYGGKQFPELIVVLQGYGVTLDLHGETFINEKTSITSSTFRTVPDAPVGSFELNLPEGPFSALGANGNLCSLPKTVLLKKKKTIKSKGHTRTIIRKIKSTIPATLSMPTIFTAQNGAVIKQSTPISVTGCTKAKNSAHKATRKDKGGKVKKH
jgi:hypothetical protein